MEHPVTHSGFSSLPGWALTSLAARWFEGIAGAPGVGSSAEPFPGALCLAPSPLPCPPQQLHTPLQCFRRGGWHWEGRRRAPRVLGTAGSTSGCCLLKQILGCLEPVFSSHRTNPCFTSCIPRIILLNQRWKRQCWVYQGAGWHLLMQWMLSHTAGKGPVSKCPDLLRSCAHPVTPSGLDHPMISVADLQMQRGTLPCLGTPVAKRDAAPAAVVDISLLHHEVVFPV